MSFKRQDKTPTVPIGAKLRKDTKDLLDAFCKYHDSDLDYAVEQILGSYIRADKAFMSHHAQQVAGSLKKVASTPGKVA